QRSTAQLDINCGRQRPRTNKLRIARVQRETRELCLGQPDRKASSNSIDLSNVGQALRLVAETLVQRWTERITSAFKGPSHANGWTPKRKRRLARREFGV